EKERDVFSRFKLEFDVPCGKRRPFMIDSLARQQGTQDCDRIPQGAKGFCRTDPHFFNGGTNTSTNTDTHTPVRKLIQSADFHSHHRGMATERVEDTCPNFEPLR